jgi:hypothetical protein
MLGVDLYFTGPSLPASAVNTLAVLEAIGTDKPIVIGELGPAARADFWGQAVSAFANIKRFRGFSLWFARGWKAWGGTPGVGSLIDGSTDAATREAFAAFLADPHIMTLARWSDVLPDKLHFPHIDTNLPWQTEIAVINTGDQTVSGTLVGVSNTGQTVNTRSFTLPAHGRRQINVAEEFANHASIGYIVFNSDSTAVQGYTKFYQSGVYRAAVPAVKEVNTSDIFIPHIDSSAIWWTGVSLLNTTATPKNLTITFNTGQNSQVSLAPNEHKAFTIASLFQGQPQPDIKSAVISNAGGVIGLELFGNNGGGSQLDGILLTGKTASTLLYPHVASDTAWWTGIVAYNPAAFPCTITITPYSDQGAPLLSSTLSIAGKEKYVGLVSGLGLPPGTAWLKIDSTRPLAGFELFATWDGKQLAAYAGGGLGGKAGIFPKIEKNGWTGIAFVNTEAGDASVMLTAYNDNGNVVATWALALGGHAKVVNFAEAIFSQDLSAATYIAYSSDRNVVGFQLNGSADGMLLDGLPGLGVGDDPVSD